MAIAPPPPTLHLQQQWLPTLSSIVLDGDSFSTELIRQFDKKQSKLHAEMVGENVSLSSDSYQSRARTPETAESTAQVQSPGLAQQAQDDNIVDRNDSSSVQLRRRSAGDLLRRSSAYLRAKFEAFKSIAPPPPPPPIAPHQQQQQQQQDLTTLPPPEEQRRSVFHSWSLSKKSQHRYQPPHADTIFGSHSHDHPSSSITSVSSLGSMQPTKIAVNTTISIPPQPQPQPQSHHQHRHSSLYHYSTTVQPPVITQYPPRPLKYAPVEPISDDHIPYPSNTESTTQLSRGIINSNHPPPKLQHKIDPHHHRISLPLFRMVKDPETSSSSSSLSQAAQQSRHSRRSSDSELHRLAATRASSSWTKRLSQWFHCHQPSKPTAPPQSKKGKEPKLAHGTTTPEVNSLAI
ncbi:hypothetical protein [Absidia glauca]|uniref:Uncharacterized protein n=1 Tax=Absidia glauca TaxID=4829 RepID=A0A163K395_ABSGL|nr:hypothetical protein [Absidia glauca]